MRVGQFAIYGDIKKVLGKSWLSCCFWNSVDRPRCDWRRGNSEVKEHFSAEASFLGVSIHCVPGQRSFLFSHPSEGHCLAQGH